MLAEGIIFFILSTVVAGEMCLYLPNMNLVGGTYDEFEAPDIRKCCMECSKDTCCKAYTFSKELKRCYLKSAINYSEEDVMMYSGVRATYHGKAASLKNVKIEGPNRLPMPFDTQEDCKQYCTAYGMYSWNQPTGIDDKGECYCINRVVRMAYNYGRVVNPLLYFSKISGQSEIAIEA